MEYKNKNTGAVISTASKLAGAWVPMNKEDIEEVEEDIEEVEEEQPKKKTRKKK